MSQNISCLNGMLGVKQASSYVGVSTATMRKWINKRNKSSKKERPPFYLIGGRFYFKPKDLDLWIDQRRKT